MLNILGFMRRELLTVGFIVLSVASWVYGAVSGVEQLWSWGIPGWGWQSIGAVLFALGVLTFLYRHQQGFGSLQKEPPTPDVGTGFKSPDVSPANPVIAEASTTPDASAVARRLYTGRVMFDHQKLLDDLLVEVAFLVFNGGPDPVYFQGTEGAMRWSRWPSGQEANLKSLPRPTLRDDQQVPIVLPPYQEALIIFNQRIPGVDAREMYDAVETDALELDLRSFVVLGYVPDGAEQVGIPLWGALRIWKPTDMVFTGRVVFAGMNVTLGATASIT